MIKECKYCKNEIEYTNVQQFGAHISNCIKNPNKKSTKHKIFKYNLNCNKCNNLYTLELTENNFNKNKYTKYCSRSCANSRIITVKHKLKTSNTLKKYYNNNS